MGAALIHADRQVNVTKLIGPFSTVRTNLIRQYFHENLCHIVILLKFVTLNIVICVLMLSGSALGRYAITRSLGLGLGLILPSYTLYTKCYNIELLGLQF